MLLRASPGTLFGNDKQGVFAPGIWNFSINSGHISKKTSPGIYKSNLELDVVA
jgi:hypothetical protein